jgi:hypothetical protein
MCGIAGIFHPDVPKPVSRERVGAMADMLAHRGPDGSGVWIAPGVGLGHRRLSIIDVEGGAQPLVTADGRVAISFNGEIYNYRELKAELETKGFPFRTDSDTEVILAAWRQWGPKCLQRLNGMFAFALYDLGSDSLFLARDRLGVKPVILWKPSRWRADLRLRAEGAARPSAFPLVARSRGRRGLSRPRLCAGRRLDRGGRQQACRRSLSPHPPRTARAQAGSVVGRRLLQSHHGSTGGACR